MKDTTKRDLMVKVLSENKNLENSDIAKILKDVYSETFGKVTMDSIRKRISELRKEFDLQKDEVEVKEEEKEAKVKVQDTDIEISKDDWLRQSAQIRVLREKITENAKTIAVLNNELDDRDNKITSLIHGASVLPVIKQVQKFVTDTNKIEEEVVMMISDSHAGEEVDPYEMEHMGEYNFQKFVDRTYFLFEKTVEIVQNQRNISNIKKLWIDMLGDIVHGELHQKETNQYAMIPVVLNTALVLSQAVAMISQYFEEIEISCVVGNHGRFEKKPPSKRIYNNWDYMVYQLMSVHLKNFKNIKFNIPQSPSCIVKRMNHTFLLQHGDAIRGGFAGIPVYGMYRAFANEQEIRKSRGGFDYMTIAHFHQDLKLRDGSLIVNGSMVGNTQYNLHKLHTTSEPMQKIYGVNNKYGISWERSMKLTHAEFNETLKYQFQDNPVFGNLVDFSELMKF